MNSGSQRVTYHHYDRGIVDRPEHVQHRDLGERAQEHTSHRQALQEQRKLLRKPQRHQREEATQIRLRVLRNHHLVSRPLVALSSTRHAAPHENIYTSR